MSKIEDRGELFLLTRGLLTIPPLRIRTVREVGFPNSAPPAHAYKKVTREAQGEAAKGRQGLGGAPGSVLVWEAPEPGASPVTILPLDSKSTLKHKARNSTRV